MTNLLLRLFVPKNGQPEDPAVRAACGRLSGTVAILLNLLLFAAKLLTGILSGSVAICADAMNNLSDASSGIVTLVGFKLAEKPADARHPYGHARFEYLSGLAISGMIVIIGFELAKTSVEKMIRPEAITVSWPLLAVLAAAILLKIWLWRFHTVLAKKIGSSALKATGVDSLNDAVSTGAVLLAAVLEYFTQWQIDGAVGLVVAVYILYSGISLAVQTISPLLGENADPELRRQIEETVSSRPQVLGYHDLMVHDYGPGQRFASLHVEMDSRLDPLLCHGIIDDLERECLTRHHVHLVIHYDPVKVGDPLVDRMHEETAEILREKDARLSLHDFRVVDSAGHRNLIFDVSLPCDLQGQEKEIRERIEKTLTAREGKPVYAVITFDPVAFNGP